MKKKQWIPSIDRSYVTLTKELFHHGGMTVHMPHLLKSCSTMKPKKAKRPEGHKWIQLISDMVKYSGFYVLHLKRRKNEN